MPFGFYSDGPRDAGGDLQEGAHRRRRRTVRRGRAGGVDLGAGAIYGVSDRLGTIEAGKIANLILATDWPWADGAEVKAVFVDGRKYEERKSDEPTEPPASDVSGTWGHDDHAARHRR